MKKVLLIMAAALMTMTQCRKQETVPATPSANTIKMTVTAGPGAKTNITDEGAITWTSGDKLYVSDGTKWLGSLTLDGEGGSASGTFTGTIQDIGEGTTTCHFFYLGHDNGMVEPTGTTDVSISFASQDGSREGALKYHLGHGSADVMVSGGVATGAVAMRTEIAIAHLKLKMDSKPYTGSVTMDVSNKMTVSPAGDFSGSGNGITIAAGTSGDRYVTLIPTTGTESVDVSFSGSSAAGSMTFGHGIQANNLYGMAAGIEVTLEAAAPKFSVGENTTVEFSPGNLWYDGSAFHFEANQTTYTGKWNSSHIDRFLWSPDKSVAVGTSESVSGSTGDVFFTNAAQTTANSGFQVDGEEAGTWRTLSKDEWVYLINTRTGNRFAKARVSGVQGLLIFPDGYSGTTGGDGIATVNKANAAFPTSDIPSDTWTSMESAGVVFLPAAGYRNGKSLYKVGSCGYYWSSSCYYSNLAYSMYFHSGSVSPQYDNYRYDGYSVRLVR